MQSNRLKWLVVCGSLGVLALNLPTSRNLSAQAVDPSSLTLLGSGDLQYVGAFRLPTTSVGASNFKYAGFGMAYNPARNSLFLTGNSFDQMTAEIAIPTALSTSGTVSSLPLASVLQPFADATEGKRPTLGVDVRIGGYLLANNRLFLDGYVYYDGSGSQSVSHFSRPLDLSSRGDVIGPYSMVVGSANNTGFSSGPMAAIPAVWQNVLGGPAMTEQCCIAIVSRTSWGPSFFSWNPSTFAQQTQVLPALYYTQEHPLDNFDIANGVFNGTTQIHGVVFPENTRSVLYFGRQGATYGYGVGVPSNPPSPPVAGDLAQGSNASTDATGKVITLPNVNVSSAVNEWIWLSSQSSPNYDGSHPGAAVIVASANSGQPNATVTVATPFAGGLTGQNFNLGNVNLYDPLDPNKGNHGYPYRSQVWGYDANDLAAVRSGTKHSYDVRPYAIWTLTPPFNNGIGAINGAAYDPATSRIYLYYPNVDGSLQDFPIVLVYKVTSGGPTAPLNVRVVR